MNRKKLLPCRLSGFDVRSSLFAAVGLFANLLLVSTAFGQIPAFPGALGFGANVTGGRAGSVYHVTTLADSGAGSFRTGVSSANRVIVFDVGGYISLASAVSVKGNITIAGQTAPGGGIGFKGGEISFASSGNIICRYIRIRPGSDTASTTDDALSFYRATNVIVDHVSMEFAPWNNIGGVSDDWQVHPVNNITVQNSIIANPTYQQFGAHTECVNGTWSWFYNIFANSHNRNPLAKINTVFINNVLYNHSAGYTTHTSTAFKHDIVNNYFIFGPATGSSPDNTWFQVDKNQSIYYAGNLKDNNKDGVLNGSATIPYWYQGPGTILTSPWSSWTTNVPVYSPDMAYCLTVSTAGALPRDEVDSLVLNQVKTLGSGPAGTGTGAAGPGGGLYTSQTQTGLGNNGYGTISGGTAATDTDQDGLPDYWETAIGTSISTDNHTSPVPAGAYVTNVPAGYTLLDEYLHFLTIPHAIVAMNGSTDADLRNFTSGFDKTPVAFTLSNITNGTAVLQPDGYTVHFVPNADFVGRARFDFQVTDGGGHALTQNFAVLVSGSLVPPTAPTNLTATAVSSSQITLAWTDTSPSESGFQIERSTDDVDFTGIGSVDANITTFTNVVAPATTYYYRVRAYNLVANSAFSNTTNATSLAGSPAVPASITATPANSRVDVGWTVSPGATSYQLKRSTISGGPYSVIASPTTSSYTDTGVTNSTTYYYVVSAVNGSGESTDSPQATATPLNTMTYPAEDATFGGGSVFEASNTGFNGTGYVNSSTTGGFLEFQDVDSGGGGSVTLRFRTALGVSSSRTGLLIVNGISQGITFSPTRAWTTWAGKEVIVTLNAGTANTIRLESNGQDLANIDELTVIGTPVVPPPTVTFANISAASGSFIVTGSGGTPNGDYYVLTSTNLALPLSNWTRIATNQFDAGGGFSSTNTINTDDQQSFYRLQLP
jgi:fibronectin type 3 domain-containing protein